MKERIAHLDKSHHNDDKDNGMSNDELNTRLGDDVPSATSQTLEGVLDQTQSLWERDLGLSQSTLEERFRPESEYSGREIWA